MTPQRTGQYKQIARQVPEAIATQRDLDLVADVFAEDAVEHGPFGDHHGPSAIRENIGGVLDAFPDLTATVEDVIAEGDRVAMRVTLRGTHEGPFLGFEPTGRSFAIRNMVLSRLEAGRIAERWLQPDVSGQLTQLGLLDLPTE
jgi:steroid delta-isomerase-like uncharacterized protein